MPPQTISGIYDSTIRRSNLSGGGSVGRWQRKARLPPNTGAGPTAAQVNFLNVCARRLGHSSGQALARFDGATWTISGVSDLIDRSLERLAKHGRARRSRPNQSQPGSVSGTAKRPAG